MIHVIGVIGTLVLLPLALVCLVIGLVRFGFAALRALAEEGVSHLRATG